MKKKGFFKKLLNGFIVGNADNDPAGISTYTLAGAQTGLSLALFLILSTPLLINIQAICASIGDVTKKGLASSMKLYYGFTTSLILMSLVVIANIFTLGANFAAVSSALNLIFPTINVLFFLPLFAGALWLIVVFKSYKTLSRILAGLGVIFLSYLVTAFILKPDWLQVTKDIFLPQIQFTPSYFMMAVAMLGTTITPFIFYWQVTEEVEDSPSVKDVKTEVGQVSWGLIFANLVSVFVIITSALTLHKAGIKVDSLAQAALALKPLAGDLAFLLFSIGIIGSGMLAIPVLTSSTAYTIAETFNWRTGLNQKVNQAKSFYAVLTLSFFVGLSLALLSFNPIKVLFYSQVVNGLITPIILAYILKLASKEVLMKQYTINKTQKTIGWFTVLIMTIVAIAAFI
ncbi:MAG: divalent metal cation transporter [Patescibacteria group bacterium]|nr:divalent metal cation transporter [Patescibacteria group bacterium]